jgi:hypothetical protein
MSKLWDIDAVFGVWPWGFKKAIGKVNNQF